MGRRKKMAEVEGHLKTGGESLEGKGRCSAEKVDPALIDDFKKMKIRRRYRYITCRIEQDTVAVDRIGERDSGIAELKADLPNSDCRYVIYDYEYTTPDGRKPSKLFFLCWMPHSATPYMKMGYSTGKRMIREVIDGVFDVQASALDQIEGAFGIETEEDEESDIDF